MKEHHSYRLSSKCCSEIKSLATKFGMSQPNIIELAIDRMAREEKMNMAPVKLDFSALDEMVDQGVERVEISGDLYGEPGFTGTINEVRDILEMMHMDTAGLTRRRGELIDAAGNVIIRAV